MTLDNFEQSLLDGWEDVHKKSQLGLWIFLALRDGPKHMALIKSFISDATNGSMQADDKSMYRTLRRFKEGLMIDFRSVESKSGPDLKQYFLTDSGKKVLAEFLERNIKLFYQPSIVQLVNNAS